MSNRMTGHSLLAESAHGMGLSSDWLSLGFLAQTIQRNAPNERVLALELAGSATKLAPVPQGHPPFCPTSAIFFCLPAPEAKNHTGKPTQLQWNWKGKSVFLWAGPLLPGQAQNVPHNTFLRPLYVASHSTQTALSRSLSKSI